MPQRVWNATREHYARDFEKPPKSIIIWRTLVVVSWLLIVVFSFFLPALLSSFSEIFSKVSDSRLPEWGNVLIVVGTYWFWILWSDGFYLAAGGDGDDWLRRWCDYIWSGTFCYGVVLLLASLHPAMGTVGVFLIFSGVEATNSKVRFWERPCRGAIQSIRMCLSDIFQITTKMVLTALTFYFLNYAFLMVTSSSSESDAFLFRIIFYLYLFMPLYLIAFEDLSASYVAGLPSGPRSRLEVGFRIQNQSKLMLVRLGGLACLVLTQVFIQFDLLWNGYIKGGGPASLAVQSVSLAAALLNGAMNLLWKVALISLVVFFAWLIFRVVTDAYAEDVKKSTKQVIRVPVLGFLLASLIRVVRELYTSFNDFAGHYLSAGKDHDHKISQEAETGQSNIKTGKSNKQTGELIDWQWGPWQAGVPITLLSTLVLNVYQQVAADIKKKEAQNDKELIALKDRKQKESTKMQANNARFSSYILDLERYLSDVKNNFDSGKAPSENYKNMLLLAKTRDLIRSFEESSANEDEWKSRKGDVLRLMYDGGALRPINSKDKEDKCLSEFHLQSEKYPYLDLRRNVAPQLDIEKRLSETQLYNGKRYSTSDCRPALLLHEMDFKEANLYRAYLSKAFLPFINLENAYAEGANLKHASLSYAYFKDANLRNADLTGTALQFADLQGANLKEAKLKDAKLNYANLRFADLSGAELTGADLKGADLTGANITGVIYDKKLGKTIHPCPLGETEEESIALEKSIKADQVLQQARAQCATRTSQTPRRVFRNRNWSGGNFSNAVFSGTELTNVNFSGANLKGVKFVNSTLKNIDFSGAVMDDAEFVNSWMKKVLFYGAIVNRIKFRNVNVEAVELTGVQYSDEVTGDSDFFKRVLMESGIQDEQADRYELSPPEKLHRSILWVLASNPNGFRPLRALYWLIPLFRDYQPESVSKPGGQK